MAKKFLPSLSSLFTLIAAFGSGAQQAAINNTLECFLEPNTQIEISAEVPGILNEVLVERGDRVKRGQVLATLRSGPERAAVELAEARVEFGKRKAIRTEELYKKKMISLHEKDEVDTEILISTLQLKQARELLKQRSITSPVDGVVIERDKDPGEYVETESLVTIVNLDPLHVEAVAAAEFYGTIRKGQSGKVTILEPHNKDYTARVTLIDQVVDAASGTIRVRLDLPNPENRIPAGLRCVVEFE